jgi:spore coat polysaccharide biosynthesis protein SpsF
MTRIIGIVQARLGSTRLRRKVLLPLGDKPMLWHLVRRMRAAHSLNDVVVATADNEENRPIVEICAAEGIPCYAGSEADLIDRFYQTGRRFEADALVRVTADCPLVDPGVIDSMVNWYRENQSDIDFVANNRPPTYPHGLDAEIFSMTALKRLSDAIRDPFKREWFTLNFTDGSMDFRTKNLPYEHDLSAHRWTVDYAEDMELVRRIFTALDSPDRVFSMADALDLFDRHPELSAINARHVHHDTGGDRGAAQAAWEVEKKLQAAS